MLRCPFCRNPKREIAYRSASPTHGRSKPVPQIVRSRKTASHLIPIRVMHFISPLIEICLKIIDMSLWAIAANLHQISIDSLCRFSHSIPFIFSNRLSRKIGIIHFRGGTQLRSFYIYIRKKILERLLLSIYLHREIIDKRMSLMKTIGIDRLTISHKFIGSLKAHLHYSRLALIEKCIVNIYIGIAIIRKTDSEDFLINSNISILNRNELIATNIIRTVICPHNISKEQKEKENYF